MVSPPPDVGSAATAAAATRTASSAQRGAPAPSGPAAVLDSADIRPLDVPAALQILIAEVRTAFDELLPADGDTPASVAGEGNAGNTGNTGNAATADLGAAAAARIIVDLVLQSLPETFDPISWSVALPKAELALQTGVQRALDAVSAWRDVTPVVVDATKESGALALSLIEEEPQNPLWPPPEWLGMAARLTRLWRRRRALRRRLADPDEVTPSGYLDEPGR
jgi:hypothetical protein